MKNAVSSTLCKLVQRQTYDVLSHRHGTVVLFVGIILIIVSAFQFGEVVLEWSEEKYSAVFNSFSDNVAGRSYQNRLCLPVPIDVVYTWVNGSDPRLLTDLRKFKMKMETEINQTSGEAVCPFTHCVPWWAVVIEPALHKNLTLTRLKALHPAMQDATSMMMSAQHQEEADNVTIIFFSDKEQVKRVLKMKLEWRGQNVSLRQAYLTSDWTVPNSVLMKTQVVMTGFPHTYSSDDLVSHLPEKYKVAVRHVDMYTEQGIAVLEISDQEIFEDMVKDDHNFTIEGKTPTVNAANLVWDLNDYRNGEDISQNRFEDNEELRYSLRSVERYAPWVRHVFIVTNGQIPSWVNLDNPRLTIISHEEIFLNMTHLPTFSSPAIEAHLHRIPGLSDKFIYLNDDVMFGKEVWPDDFYSHAGGQKVYLTWPVPDCQDGCPSSWIRDGYCDKACNNSECEWDGGDCKGGASSNVAGQGASWQEAGISDDLYCHSGCANNWLADRYCDQSCNVFECGYDVGDCGVANFHKLHRVDLDPAITHYELPRGVRIAYFNLTTVIVGWELKEGQYQENALIRAATVAKKFKTLSLILHNKQNSSLLQFELEGVVDNNTVSYKFNVTVDARPALVKEKNETQALNKTVIGDKHGVNKTAGKSNETETRFTFRDIPQEKRGPRVKLVRDVFASEDVDLSKYILPDSIEHQWQELVHQKESGDLTEKGFSVRQAELWQLLTEQLQKEGKQPELKPPTETEAPAVVTEHHDNVPLHVHHAVDDTHAVEQDKAVDAAEAQPADQDAHIGGEQPLADVAGHEAQKSAHNIGQQDGLPVQAGAAVDAGDDAAKIVENMGQNDQVQLDVAGVNADGPDARKTLDGVVKVNEVYRDVKLAPSVQEGIPAAPNQNLVGHELAGHVPTVKKDRVSDDAVSEYLLAKQQESQKLVEKNEQTNAQAKNTSEHIDVNKAEMQVPANDSFRSRKLNSVVILPDEDGDERSKDNILRFDDDDLGFLPWERNGEFEKLSQKVDAMKEHALLYEDNHIPTRRLLDTFGDSLRHVNRIYNKAYGYKARKVPAHMPHMIDKNIMYELQATYPNEWDVTSSHKVRSSDDMQFAFSYFYYLMGVPKPRHVSEIFDYIDTDHSTVLSDREIRTLATRLYDLPLDLQTLTGLEQMIINCSQHLPPEISASPPGQTEEVYYDKNMPQVTRALVIQCGPLAKLMLEKFPAENRYRHEIIGDEEVAFKMIKTNVSQVVGQLDDIRKNPKKFVCLNDNIDHSKSHAQTVKAVLHDFYESLYPIPSSFELQREYRNRFLHMSELREWRKYRDLLKTWTQVALFILIMYTVGSFFGDRIESFQRRYLRWTRRSTSDGSESSSSSADEAPSRIVTV